MKKSLILSTAISLLATTPCYAVDWDTLVNSLIGNRGTGSVPLNDQAQLKAVIANREALIEQHIEAGARAGTLTSAEEQDLRNGLNSVENHEGTFLADGNLSEAESRSLVDELSRLDMKVNAYLTNATATGYAAVPNRNDRRYPHGNAYGYWTHHERRDNQDDQAPNQAAVQAMIDSKQAELDSAVSHAALNGSLSNSDARNLRYALSQVATAERQALTDGVLSVREETDLTTQLNDIASRLQAATVASARYGRGGRYGGGGSGRYGGGGSGRYGGGGSGRYGGGGRDTTSYQTYLHQRIANALATGKMSADQANNLYTQERGINFYETQYRKYGTNYTYEQQRSILSKLDQLSASIDAVIGVGVR